MHLKQVIVLTAALFVCSWANETSSTEKSVPPAENTTIDTAKSSENVTSTPADLTTAAPMSTTSTASTAAQAVTIAQTAALSQMPNSSGACDTLLADVRAITFRPELVILNLTNSTSSFCTTQWNVSKQFKEKCVKADDKSADAMKVTISLDVYDLLCANNRSLIGLPDAGNVCQSSVTNVSKKCTNATYSFPSEIPLKQATSASCAENARLKDCIVSGLKEGCSVDQQKALGGLINTIMPGKCDNSTVVSTTKAPSVITTTKPRNSGLRLNVTPFALLSTVLFALAS